MPTITLFRDAWPKNPVELTAEVSQDAFVKYQELVSCGLTLRCSVIASIRAVAYSIDDRARGDFDSVIVPQSASPSPLDLEVMLLRFSRERYQAFVQSHDDEVMAMEDDGIEEMI